MGMFKKKQHEQVRRARISDNNDAYIYRRSRTMTGSLSSSVRAAGETHATLRSDRLKHHDLRLTRRKITWLLVGCLAAAGLLYGLLLQFIWSVDFGSSTIAVNQRQLYQSSIESYLGSHPGERFFMTLNNDNLLASVQKSHPEVKNISLSPNGIFKPISATINLRQAVATWTLQGKTYYIDDHGVAFTQAPTTKPSLVVEDKTGINPDDIGAVASERMLYYIGRLVALVQSKGLVVSKIELPAGTSRQVDLYLEGRGYTIKTHLDRDPAGQAADVVSAVTFFDSRGLRPQYVDVRVSSKAFYR